MEILQSETTEIYEFGPYRLDVGQHKLERSDGSTNGALPEKAFQTLVYLVRNQGRLVTKNELIDAVWPDTAVEENNLNKTIHTIRHTLRENPKGAQYIETVRKHGYRFIADVRKVDGNDSGRSAVKGFAEQVNHDNPRVDNVPPAPLKGRTEHRRHESGPYRAAVAALGLTAALGLGAWLTSDYWRPFGVPVQLASDNSGKLPLKNAADTGHSPAYDLYIRGKVKVASENRDDTEAAIRYLEEAVALEPNFSEAFAALARGYNTMAFKYSSGAEAKRFHENAEVAIEKALALDPNLAEAHFARGLILWTNIKAFPHEAAIQSYNRAIALDPDLDEAHHQLSMVYSHIGLVEEARQSVDKALKINPNNTLARFRSGVYLEYLGEFDEAIAVFKTIPRDHTPLLMNRSLAETLIQAGRADEVHAIVEDHLKRHPQDEGGSFTGVKALLLAKAGRHQEAEDAIRQAVQIGQGLDIFTIRPTMPRAPTLL